MIGQALQVAWYRFRTTFRSRRGGYLSVILLVSLVGGVAMGAVKALTADGLFIGQTPDFFEFLQNLANVADEAEREL